MSRFMCCAVLTWTGAACFGQERINLQEAPRLQPSRQFTQPSKSTVKPPAKQLPAAAGQRQFTSRGKLRRWVDSTGRFQVQAAIVSRTPESVTLRRADGPIVRVPIRRLSNADKEYLKQIADRRLTKLPPLPADLVYVQVSGRMLRRFMTRPVFRHSAVHDTIVGTPVRGTADTTGAVSLRLVPARSRAVLDVLFHGQILSQTTGFGGPVQVHSSGMTNFSAAKRLMLDEQGIEVYPARATAQTSTAINGLSTHLPRIRGWIARRIGARRAADMTPAAEAESARKAEAQIVAQFDREVLGQLLAARSQWLQAMSSLPIDGDLFVGKVRFATTSDYLHVAIHQESGQWSRLRPPSPTTLGSPNVAVHIHASLVDRVVQDPRWQQSLEPLVNSLLAGEVPQLVGIVPIEPRTELKKSADGAWWSLVVR